MFYSLQTTHLSPSDIIYLYQNACKQNEWCQLSVKYFE